MAIGKGAVLLHGVNSAITSDAHVALGDGNAVIVELFPTGINPVAQFQLFDSAEEATGYYPVLDPSGLQTGLTPNTVNKYLVPNVLPYVRIRVTPTSGSWSARVTPVLATQPAAANPLLVAGSDGATAHDLLTDVSGRLIVAPSGGVTPATAQVNDSLIGATTVVVGTAGKRVYVYAYALVAAAAVQATWQDTSGAPVVLEGPMALPANGGLAPSIPPPSYLFATPVGEGLALSLGAAVQVGGRVSYYSQ